MMMMCGESFVARTDGTLVLLPMHTIIHHAAEECQQPATVHVLRSDVLNALESVDAVGRTRAEELSTAGAEAGACGCESRLKVQP